MPFESNKINSAKALLAIALKYEASKRPAPSVIASGHGEVARRIVQIAKENNIPIKQNEELASILSLVELGETIPCEAFAVVAEIIAYIYKNNHSKTS